VHGPGIKTEANVRYSAAVAGLVAAAFWTPAPADRVAARQQPTAPAYDAVVRGMTCTQSRSAKGQLDCAYRVGKALEFSIAGVGEKDAGILVVHANGLDADFYFGFGLEHGCIIVWPGKATLDLWRPRGIWPTPAFVSPKNGKVYTSWHECSLAGMRSP
jgi:hypothetical protein